MSVETNLQLLQQWVAEAWNKGDLSLIDQKFSPDHVMHEPGLPEQKLVGLEAFKGFVGSFRPAVPDLHVTIEDVVAQDDKIAWRFNMTGTQKGEMMGLPPSGKSFSVSGTIISRFENGLWAEDYVHWDTLGLLQQLGALPKMG